MNVYEAINKIMAELPAIPKNRRNQQQGFSYQFRGIDDVYLALQDLMAEFKVTAWPTVLSEHYEEFQTKSGGTSTAVRLKVQYKFVCSDEPDKFENVVTLGEAFDTSDKASNKAMSVAHKYACLQLFMIPTEEAKDPENETILKEKKSPIINHAVSSTRPLPAPANSGTPSTGAKPTPKGDLQSDLERLRKEHVKPPAKVSLPYKDQEEPWPEDYRGPQK